MCALSYTQSFVYELITFDSCGVCCVLFTELTAEQQEFRDLAAKFTREEIIPVAAEYDRSGEVCVVCGVYAYKYV